MSEAEHTLAYEACPDCGSANAVQLRQSSRNKRLRWHESVNCECCGLHCEADGIGFPPDEFRKRLIESQGLWQVKVVEIKSKLDMLKVIRGALGSDMKEVARIVKELPVVVYIGTNGEARWLVHLLKDAGEKAVLEKI